LALKPAQEVTRADDCDAGRSDQGASDLATHSVDFPGILGVGRCEELAFDLGPRGEAEA
jgi:hypothetical protein